MQDVIIIVFKFQLVIYERKKCNKEPSLRLSQHPASYLKCEDINFKQTRKPSALTCQGTAFRTHAEFSATCGSLGINFPFTARRVEESILVWIRMYRMICTSDKLPINTAGIIRMYGN
jgi:hypothetical protein